MSSQVEPFTLPRLCVLSACMLSSPSQDNMHDTFRLHGLAHFLSSQPAGEARLQLLSPLGVAELAMEGSAPLRRNVKRFRGGLVVKAHRLV